LCFVFPIKPKILRKDIKRWVISYSLFLDATFAKKVAAELVLLISLANHKSTPETFTGMLLWVLIRNY
jgi:hypothetical protein